MLANVLLFAPFGFGFAWVLERSQKLGRRCRWPVALGLISAGSCAFSFLIELAQNFMPTRTSSWFDVLANTAGGPLGWIVFRLTGRRIERLLFSCSEALFRAVSARSLTALFAAYLTLGIVLSIHLGRMAMLSNWELSYPLTIGNVPAGERPWHGGVGKLAIADRVLTLPEAQRAFLGGPGFGASDGVLASYQFDNPLEGTDGWGRGPALFRAPRLPAGSRKQSGSGSGEGWLQSQGATELIARRIRDANRVSIYLECSADQGLQPGTHPIVTLGEDMEQNDFMLGQYYSSLVLRLRTPLSETPWEVAQYRAVRFFLTPGVHKILLTYDGAVIRSYLDGKAGYAPELGPGAALFRHIHRLHPFETFGYKAIYYGLLFMPLGAILALVKGTKVVPVPAVVCSLLAPGLILEYILAAACHRPLYLKNSLLAIGFSAASYAFFRRYVPRDARDRGTASARNVGV